MNCQQGDLALVIGPPGEAGVGKVVKCLKLILTGTPTHSLDRIWHSTLFTDTWVTDTLIYPPPEFTNWGEVNYMVADRYLLPLRPPASADTDTAEREVTEGYGA